MARAMGLVGSDEGVVLADQLQPAWKSLIKALMS
jgi:hypothetical protein